MAPRATWQHLEEELQHLHLAAYQIWSRLLVLLHTFYVDATSLILAVSTHFKPSSGPWATLC